MRRPDLIAPWLYSGSLLNLGVLLGGLAAALLSREFAIRVPPRGELVKGAAGGLLMGVGAMLAFGCNIGGFFSATSALSLSGFGMMLGLGARRLPGPALSAVGDGAPAGVVDAGGGRVYRGAGAPSRAASRWPGAGRWCWRCSCCRSSTRARAIATQGVFLLFGVAFGVIFQRSRFCLVRAFREPFMTGDAEHTRAAALALVGQHAGLRDPEVHRPQGQGRLGVPAAPASARCAGGTLFGVGMTLAGGCGAGSIWRAGEGQVKLWAALGVLRAGRLARAAGRWCRPGSLGKLGVGGVPALGARLGRAPSCSSLAVVAGVGAAATWNEADASRFSALGLCYFTDASAEETGMDG